MILIVYQYIHIVDRELHVQVYVYMYMYMYSVLHEYYAKPLWLTFLFYYFVLGGDRIAAEEEVALCTIEVPLLSVGEDGEPSTFYDTTTHCQQFRVPLA